MFLLTCKSDLFRIGQGTTVPMTEATQKVVGQASGLHSQTHHLPPGVEFSLGSPPGLYLWHLSLPRAPPPSKSCPSSQAYLIPMSFLSTVELNRSLSLLNKHHSTDSLGHEMGSRLSLRSQGQLHGHLQGDQYQIISQQRHTVSSGIRGCS